MDRCPLNGQKLSELKEIKRKWVLAMGSEAHGISEKTIKRLDRVYTITKEGKGESLNVAVAMGIFKQTYLLIGFLSPLARQVLILVIMDNQDLEPYESINVNTVCFWDSYFFIPIFSSYSWNT